MTYRLEALGDQVLETFESGNAALDDWLRLHARTATGHGTRSYLLVDDQRRVLGYFALAPHLLLRDDAPVSLARGAPQHIPAILLAKLALDSSIQRQGIGAELLVGAIEIALDAARRAGGRLILVDAIDEAAAAFLLRHDFQPLPGRPDRLLLKLSTAAKALGHPWP